MNRNFPPLLPDRSSGAWRRIASIVALILVLFLALGSSGGSGGDRDDDDHDGSSRMNPTATPCSGEIFLRGPVEASDADARSLTVFGLTFRVNEDTRLSNINLSVLAEGDFIAMRGFQASGGGVVASCLVRQATRHEVELRGPIDAGSIAATRLFILGIEVQVDDNTVFEDGRLTKEAFMAQLKPDDLVEVEGQLQAGGPIRAGAIEFDDNDGSFGSNDDDDGAFGDDDDDDGLGDDDDDGSSQDDDN